MPSKKMCIEFFVFHNRSKEEGEHFFRYHQSRDWMKGFTRIKYWRVEAIDRIKQLVKQDKQKNKSARGVEEQRRQTAPPDLEPW